MSLSAADHWAEVFADFDRIDERLEAIRPDVPEWAQHAFHQQRERVEQTRGKLETFKKVVGL